MLDELRKKPPFLKEAYAFWGAVAATMLIGAVWAVSLSVRFTEHDSLSASSSESGGSGAFKQFFQQIKGNMAASWQAKRQSAETPPPDETDRTAAETPASSTPAAASTAPAIIIATSSPRTVEIGTTSTTRP